MYSVSIREFFIFSSYFFFFRPGWRAFLRELLFPEDGVRQDEQRTKSPGCTCSGVAAITSADRGRQPFAPNPRKIHNNPHPRQVSQFRSKTGTRASSTWTSNPIRNRPGSHQKLVFAFSWQKFPKHLEMLGQPRKKRRKRIREKKKSDELLFPTVAMPRVKGP